MKKIHLIRTAGLLEYRLQKSALVSSYKSSKFYSKFVYPVKHSITVSIEQSVILHVVDSLFTNLLYLPLRVYGVFLMAFTLYASAGSLLKSFLTVGSWIDIHTFFGAFCGLVLSVMLLLSPGRETLAVAVCDSRIFSHLFFDILGLYKPPFEKDRITSGWTWWVFIAATLISFLTVFLTPLTLLITLLVVIFCKLTLTSPEGGLLLAVGCLPFLPDWVISLMVLFVLFSYLVKLIRGKRNLSLSVCYIGMLLFLILVVIGGIRTGVSVVSLCTAIAVFFLATLLFKEKVWLPRVASAITVSAVFAAVRGVIIYLLSMIPEKYGQHLTFLPKEDFPTNMQTPEFFGCLFIVATVLFFVRYLRSGGFSNRMLFIISALLLVLGVVVSRSPMVVIAVLAALLSLLLLCKWQLVIPYLLVVAFTVVGYIFFLPERIKNYVEQFMFGFSTAPDALLAECKKSLSAFAFGLGQGTADVGNAYTHVLVEWGLFGVLFLGFTIAWVLCYCRLAIRVKKEPGNVRSLMYAFLSAFFGLAVLSVGTDIWKNASTLLLFFLVLGMIYVSSQILIKESELENPYSELDVDIRIVRPREKKTSLFKKAKREVEADNE